jgi:hypothetical protein
VLTLLWGVLPVAIVQWMGYTEPLFTTLAAWALYGVLTGRWLRAPDARSGSRARKRSYAALQVEWRSYARPETAAGPPCASRSSQAQPLPPRGGVLHPAAHSLMPGAQRLEGRTAGGVVAVRGGRDGHHAPVLGDQPPAVTAGAVHADLTARTGNRRRSATLSGSRHCPPPLRRHVRIY